MACTSLTNGRICVNLSEGAVNIDYNKTGGSRIKLRFGYNLRGVDHYDNGAFEMGAGDHRYFQWSSVAYGSDGVVGFAEVENQGRFQTPPTYDN